MATADLASWDPHLSAAVPGRGSAPSSVKLAPGGADRTGHAARPRDTGGIDRRDIIGW